MKKIFILALFFAFTSTAFAQELELGIKITPSIAGNRVIAPSDIDFDKDGANFRFGFGVIADLYFTDNAAFSTGLSFTGKGGTVSYANSLITPGTTTGRTIDEISLQYLEIPLTVKLFTNEVAPDMHVYFQTGFSLNPRMGAKVNGEKLDQNDEKYSKRFNVIDADVILGSGLEYQVGETTKLFGGLSYHRGLISIDDYYESKNDKIELRNNVISLDLGVKF